MVTLLQFINGIIYKILGPALSTHLAHSFVGKFIFNMLNSSKEEYSIYKTSDNILLKLNKSEALTLGIFYLGTLNKIETSYLKKVLKEGNTFIDVGAYVDGYYSLLAAKIVGEKGTVIAFEPHPLYFKRFKENVKLNKFKNILCEEIAISDKNGADYIYTANEASSLIKENANNSKSGNSSKISIKTQTLDNFIKKSKIDKVHLLKIDVEGFEMHVLRGAKKLLSSAHAPIIIIEVFDKLLKADGSSENEVVKFLTDLDYKPFIFQDTIRPYEKSNIGTLNMLFIK